jgi:hypothetical protein
LGRNPSAAEIGEHGQCKLQVGVASAEQAPGGHGASSRRAWSKLQEGSKLHGVTEKNRGGVVEEKHLLDA